MRNPAIRRTVRLTVSLIGLDQTVWRELIVDHALSLAELHDAVSLAFGWSPAEHHVFVDRLPDHLLPDRPELDLALVGSDDWMRYRRPAPSLSPRRWGDRWTMIDWRDPDVHDETSTRIGDALYESMLFYANDTAGTWWCRIEAHGDDVEPSGTPRARLTTGSGRAPLPGGPSVDELPRLQDILLDPAHPDHDRVSAVFDAQVGPWARYRPNVADLDLARYDVARRFAPARAAARSRNGAVGETALDRLIEELPENKRPGLRRHLLQHGLDQAGPIDPEAAASATTAFSWLLAAVGADGLALADDGMLDPAVAGAGAASLGWPVERIDALIAAAKRLGLVRRLRGRLVGIKAALACGTSATALWAYIAMRLPEFSTAWRYDPRGTLLLLAVVDGDLEHADFEERMAASLRAVEHDPWRWWGGGGRYDAPSEWWQEGAWDRVDAPNAAHDDALRPLDRLLETLTMMGLESTADGGWSVPPSLRSLARAALTATR